MLTIKYSNFLIEAVFQEEIYAPTKDAFPNSNQLIIVS